MARVAAVKDVAEEVKTFELEPAGGSAFPPFEAGAHIDVLLDGGMARSYSLCNDPSEAGRYVIAVRRQKDGEGGSVRMADTVHEGDTLNIRAPRNNFRLCENATSSVFLAGGIGITPIFAMVLKLEREGADWSLYYASPSRGRTAFREELEALEAKKPGRVHFHFDEEAEVETVDISSILSAHRNTGTHFYCCGPTGMLKTFETLTADLPEDSVHTEHFSAGQVVDKSGTFEVEFKRLGKVVTIHEGETILDAAIEAGANVAYSCEEGVCGSCETLILEGEPDHRDEVLSHHERQTGKKMMICCSRSKSSRLVLDI